MGATVIIERLDTTELGLGAETVKMIRQNEEDAIRWKVLMATAPGRLAEQIRKQVEEQMAGALRDKHYHSEGYGRA